jgi:hypothetical protein
MAHPGIQRSQFSLSTLLLATLLFGAFLGTNLRPFQYDLHDSGINVKCSTFGFPFRFYHEHAVFGSGGSSSGMTASPLALLLNLAVTVVAPLIVATESSRRGQKPETDRVYSRPVKYASAVLTCIAIVCIAVLNLQNGRSIAAGMSTLANSNNSNNSQGCWLYVLLESGWPVRTYRFVGAKVQNGILDVSINGEAVSRSTYEKPTIRTTYLERQFGRAHLFDTSESSSVYNLLAAVLLAGSTYVASTICVRWVIGRWSHATPAA